ncbi:GHKL domain-containing protein [Clostridium sp. DSM 17811]|nr:sensor histidine kinase [Clostridium sp. DSM 17811]MBU3100059.1 GHKL domain-containing protein [Clostridium sp. DSM 17811]
MENQQIFQIANLLSIYCVLPLQYVVEYYFYKNFLGFKNKAWRFILGFAFITAIDFFSMKLQGLIWRILIYNVVWFIIIYILCNGDFFIKLYAVLVNDTILLLISLSFLTFDFGLIPMVSNMNILFRENVILYFTKNVVTDSIRYIALFLFLKNICKFLNLKEKSINIYQSLYLLIPCLASYSLAIIFFMIQTIKIGDKQYYLPYLFPKIYYALPFVSFTLLFSIVITAYTFKKMLEGEDEKQRNMIMEQQFKLQLEHSKNIAQFYSGISSVIHDLNNHLACLKSLTEDNNIEEIKKYLNNIGNTVSKLDFKIKTGNSISDAVINEKYNIAQGEGIEFICDFILPTESLFQPIDLCVILGNSLDNAIEACRKITDNTIDKVIAVKSYIRGMYLIIEVSNTTTGKLQYSENQITSTKLDKRNHGIGISNIKMAIKKYDGIMDIVLEKNKFSMNVMIKIRGD